MITIWAEIKSLIMHIPLFATAWTSDSNLAKIAVILCLTTTPIAILVAAASIFLADIEFRYVTNKEKTESYLMICAFALLIALGPWIGLKFAYGF